MRFDEALFIMESTARKKELRSHPAVHNGVLTMKKLAKEMAITMSGAKGENLVSRTLEYLNRPNTQIFRNVYITDGIDETELDGTATLLWMRRWPIGKHRLGLSSTLSVKYGRFKRLEESAEKRS